MELTRNKIKKVLISIVFTFLFVLLISIVSAQIPYPQYNVPYSYYGEAGFYSGALTAQQCEAGGDFVLEIPPGACSPMAVRSDLLEEQKVPVLCRLSALKINPAIEIPQITEISVLQQTPNPYIESITYHPARTGLRTAFSELVGSPTLNNLGYLVVFIKQQATEKEMPDKIISNLTARIKYNLEKSMGIIDEEIVSAEIPGDKEWEREYKKYSFWLGKGYLRVQSIDENQAKISVYYNAFKNPVSTVTLKAGSESKNIWLPGFYCSAGIALRLNSIDYPRTRAEMVVNGDKLIATEKTKIKDSGCEVKSIEPSIYGFGGKVKLSCPGGIYTLEKDISKNATLKINDVSASFAIGTDNDKIPNTASLSLNTVDNVLTKDGKILKVAVFSETTDANTKKKIYKKVRDVLSGAKSLSIPPTDSQEIIKALQNELKENILFFQGTKTWVIVDSGKIEEKGKYDLNIVIEKIEGLENKGMSEDVREYYDNAIKAYKEVAETYPNTKDSENNNTFVGATAMLEAADKAEQLGQKKDEAHILKDLILRYSGTAIAEKAKEKLDNILMSSDDSKASAYIISGGRGYRISLSEIVEPSEEEQSVELSVSGSNVKTYILGDTPLSNWSIEKINENNVEFKKINADIKITINRGEEKSLDGKVVKIYKINLRRLVHVSVLPQSNKGVTYSNFTFAVGIEKRGIQLNPQQTQNMITDINKTIADWERENSKLEKISQQWSRACFVGATALWLTNFLDSVDSAATARKEVMRGFGGEGGYIQYCEGAKARGEYTSISKCLYDKGDAINKETKIAEEAIKSRDEIMQKIKADAKLNEKYKIWAGGEKVGLFTTQKIINTSGLALALQEQVFFKYGEGKEKNISSINYKDGSTTNSISNSTITDILGKTSKLDSESEIGDLLLYLELQKKSCESSTESLICRNNNNVLGRKLINYEQEFADKQQEERIKDLLGISYIPGAHARDKVTAPAIIIEGKTGGEIGQKYNIPELVLVGSSYINKKITVAYFTYELENERKTYFAIVDYSGRGKEYLIKNLYELQTEAKTKQEITIEVYNEFKNKDIDPMKNLVEANEEIEKRVAEQKAVWKEGKRGPIGVAVLKDKWPRGLGFSVNGEKEEACTGSYKGELKIRFWESGSYDGLPALMPIDVENGYYFATRSSSTGLEAYQESGRVSYFYLCHVGKDGIPNFDFGLGQAGDDKCTPVPYSNMPVEGRALCGRDLKELAAKATSCVQEASVSYKSGKRDISTSCCKQCTIGAPAVSAPTSTCEDFMDPQSCNLLYNLCDPVICPSSRCDLGGKYPVEDVIQTGVIGGLTLCSPNFPEVAMPVCLPAVTGGIENMITVLKAGRDCLQENLASGKTVGICDQITSIYWCNFFWREITPFLKVSMPNILYGVLGGGKGGGEYANFMQAWSDAGSSAQYFTQTYAKNTFNAFKLRSTAEIGTEVCKGFVSLRYPNSGDILDELSKPESPYQVNSWFSEAPLTTATTPAMSSYHVYYHIYAGKDKGRYYSIYLTMPPAGGYYEIPERFPVPQAMGYIAAGEYVDVKKDFVAPSNYLQLCVSIDGKEECGFQKATTTFGIDNLVSAYTSEQAVQSKINSEEECISGTAGVFPSASLTTLNVQAMAEEMLEPQIYRRGIVRVCSNDNPGLGVGEGRWEPIGYCNSATGVKCWLDKNSVEAAIKDLGIQNKTFTEAANLSEKMMVMEGFMSRSESSEKLMSIEKDIPNKLDEIKDIISKSGTPLSYDAKKLISSNLTNITNRLQQIIKRSVSEQHRAKAQLEIGALYNEIVNILIKPKEKVETQKEAGKEAKETIIEKEIQETFFVLFDFDNDTVEEQYKREIESKIKSIKSFKNNIILLEGYASIEGSDTYNDELALRRAEAVKKIIEPLVTDVKITAAGRGETAKFSAISNKNATAEFERLSKITDIEKRKQEASESTILSEDRRVSISYEAIVEEKVTVEKETAEKTETAGETEEQPTGKNIFVYQLSDAESFSDVVKKFFPTKTGEGAINDAIQRIKSSNPNMNLADANTIMGSQKIKISFSLNEYNEFIKKHPQSKCDDCGKVAGITLPSPFAGSSNIISPDTKIPRVFGWCSLEECNIISLKKSGTLIAPESCYYKKRNINILGKTITKVNVLASCTSCSKAKTCSEFDDNKERCESAECMKEAGLTCAWQKNKCVPLDAKIEYGKAEKEYNKLAADNPVGAAKIMAGFITNFTRNTEATDAIKLLEDAADYLNVNKRYGESLQIYELMGQFANVKGNDELAEISKLALYRADAYKAYNYFINNMKNCLNSAENSCKCKPFDINQIKTGLDLYRHYSIKISEKDSKLQAQLFYYNNAVRNDTINSKLCYFKSSFSIDYFSKNYASNAVDKYLIEKIILFSDDKKLTISSQDSNIVVSGLSSVPGLSDYLEAKGLFKSNSNVCFVPKSTYMAAGTSQDYVTSANLNSC